MWSMTSTNLKPDRGQNFDKVKMSRFCGKKHLFHLRYLFTYYIVKHMDASVFKSLFFLSFFFCIFHSATLRQQQMVQFLLQSSEPTEPGPNPGSLARKEAAWGQEFVVPCFIFWQRLLSCVGRNLFEAEVGPVYSYFLSSLLRRVQAKPEGKEKRQEANHLYICGNHLYICGNKSRLRAEVKLPFEVFHFSIDLIHFRWIHIFGEKYVI